MLGNLLMSIETIENKPYYIKYCFLIDECLNDFDYRILNKEKHMIIRMPKMTSDTVIAQKLIETSSILLTKDRDFTNKKDYPPENYFGIFLFQFDDGHPKVKKIRNLMINKLLTFLKFNNPIGQIFVIRVKYKTQTQIEIVNFGISKKNKHAAIF